MALLQAFLSLLALCLLPHICCLSLLSHDEILLEGGHSRSFHFGSDFRQSVYHSLKPHVDGTLLVVAEHHSVLFPNNGQVWLGFDAIRGGHVASGRGVLGQAADRVAARVRDVRVGDLGAYLYDAHLLGKCNVVVHDLFPNVLRLSIFIQTGAEYS